MNNIVLKEEIKNAYVSFMSRRTDLKGLVSDLYISSLLPLEVVQIRHGRV